MSEKSWISWVFHHQNSGILWINLPPDISHAAGDEFALQPHFKDHPVFGQRSHPHHPPTGDSASWKCGKNANHYQEIAIGISYGMSGEDHHSATWLKMMEMRWWSLGDCSPIGQFLTLACQTAWNPLAGCWTSMKFTILQPMPFPQCISAEEALQIRIPKPRVSLKLMGILYYIYIYMYTIVYISKALLLGIYIPILHTIAFSHLKHDPQAAWAASVAAGRRPWAALERPERGGRGHFGSCFGLMMVPNTAKIKSMSSMRWFGCIWMYLEWWST